MSITSAADREGLEAAGRAVSATIDALAAAVRSGVTAADLDAVAGAHLRAARGALRAGAGLRISWHGPHQRQRRSDARRARPAAHRLVRCAARAFEAALDVATAGRKVREIGRAVERVVRAEGFTVIRGLTGHEIGRTIHEPPNVPNHFDPWQQDVLTDGLVLTIDGASRSERGSRGSIWQTGLAPVR